MLRAALGVALAFSGLRAVEGATGFSTFRQVRKAGVLAMTKITSAGTPGLVYSGCDDPAYGCELWFYDFNNEPRLVADIDAGPFHSIPTGFTLNGSSTLYFAATTAALGQELYQWDATKGLNSTAVKLVYDLTIGPQSSFPAQMCMLNGLLYFSAFLGPTVGTELAVYNPTVQDPLPPVSMVQDINRGSASSSPSALTAYQGKLFFQADSAGFGVEPWMYDPMTFTATIIMDLMPGTSSSFPFWFTPFNGRLYFQAIGPRVGGELYSYDSTRPAGSEIKLVADIAPGNKTLTATANVTFSEPNPSYPAELTPFGSSMLFFYAQTETNGSELYVMDATSENVTMVYDLTPGMDGSDPSSLVIFGGGLYFGASSPSTGKEIYYVNLTAGAAGPYSTTSAGVPIPKLAADVNPGIPGSSPGFLTPANGTRFLYFTAFNATAGSGIWQMNDASLAGAVLPTTTPSPTATMTSSRTPNATMTQTSNSTVSSTPSPSESLTASGTVNASMSYTISPSYTPTYTRSNSESLSSSESASETPTQTRTQTASQTATKSRSESASLSRSFSATTTRTASVSPSVPASPSTSNSVPPRPSTSASPTALSGVGIGANAALAAGEAGPAVDSYALTVGLSVTFSIVGALICAYGFYFCYWKPKTAAEDAAERAELRKEEEEEHRRKRARMRGDTDDDDDDDDDADAPAFSQGKRGNRPSMTRGNKPGGARKKGNGGGRPQGGFDDDDEYGGYDERELGADHLKALESGGPAVVAVSGPPGGPGGAGGGGNKRAPPRQAPRPSMSTPRNINMFPPTAGAGHDLSSYRSTSTRDMIGASRGGTKSLRLLSNNRDIVAPAVSPERSQHSQRDLIGGGGSQGISRTAIINPVAAMGMGGGGVNAMITPGGRRITAVPRPPGVGPSPGSRPQSAVISRGHTSLSSPMSPLQASQFDAYRSRGTAGGTSVSPTRPRGLDV